MLGGVALDQAAVGFLTNRSRMLRGQVGEEPFTADDWCRRMLQSQQAAAMMPATSLPPSSWATRCSALQRQAGAGTEAGHELRLPAR